MSIRNVNQRSKILFMKSEMELMKSTNKSLVNPTPGMGVLFHMVRYNVTHSHVLRWVTTKKQKWCHFLENLQKYHRKYTGFIHAKQMGGYHAWFWDIWVQFRHEMIRKSPIITHSPKWVIICGFVSYFMCNIGQNISKTSMVTHNLFCMVETNVLQGIFMQIFKKLTSLLFFCSDSP